MVFKYEFSELILFIYYWYFTQFACFYWWSSCILFSKTLNLRINWFWFSASVGCLQYDMLVCWFKLFIGELCYNNTTGFVTMTLLRGDCCKTDLLGLIFYLMITCEIFRGEAGWNYEWVWESLLRSLLSEGLSVNFWEAFIYS